MIAAYLQERHGRWDFHLSALAFALRTAVSESTGYTPARLFLGRDIALPWDTMVGGEAWKQPVDLEEVVEQVRSNVKKAQARQKRNYDKKRSNVTYRVGDLVWLRSHPLSSADRHKIAKFMPKWLGPCRVTEVLSELVYRLSEEKTKRELGTHNVADLKPYVGREVGSRQRELLDGEEPASATEDMAFPEFLRDIATNAEELINPRIREKVFDPFSPDDAVAAGPSNREYLGLGQEPGKDPPRETDPPRVQESFDPESIQDNSCENGFVPVTDAANEIGRA
ncbi:polyprotein of retroviral, partial [Lasius niger]